MFSTIKHKGLWFSGIVSYLDLLFMTTANNSFRYSLSMGVVQGSVRLQRRLQEFHRLLTSSTDSLQVQKDGSNPLIIPITFAFFLLSDLIYSFCFLSYVSLLGLKRYLPYLFCIMWLSCPLLLSKRKNPS